MIFRTNHATGISSFECTINEDDSIFELFQKISGALWANQSLPISNVIFKHSDVILDVNKALLNLIGEQNSIIDCLVNDEPNLLMILQVYRNCKNRVYKYVLVKRSIDPIQLQEYLSNLFSIEIIGVFGIDNAGLLKKMEKLDGEYVVIVEREWCKFIIHSILGGDESKTVECVNGSMVSELKRIIANEYGYDINDFSLFFDKYWLDENNPIYLYQIGKDAVVRYCHFEKVSVFEKIDNLEKVGSFSIIYRAKIIPTRETITIKRYNCSGQSQSVESYKYMIRELVSLTRIGDNQRLVQLKAFYRDENAFYIGLEHMVGGSIDTYISKNWPLDESLIRKWSKQILQGLHILHGENIIHRDLKPSNILLDGNNDIKISGFSFSKYLMGATSSQLSQGFVQSKSGKYNYMAPEVFEEDDSGWKVDIWSFGAILVEIVTGKPPFHELNEVDVAIEIARTGTIVYTLPPHGISTELEYFISRCLKSDPHERPRPGELLEDPFLRLRDAEIEMGGV